MSQVQAEQRRELMGKIVSVRRGTSNRDVLDILDFAEHQLVNGAADRASAPKKAEPAQSIDPAQCPECQARKKKHAERMQRWRSGAAKKKTKKRKR